MAAEETMPTKQGDISLLNDPVAQELLHAPIPAHLSYVWTDGSPRVIPIGFTWTGSELVTGTPHNAPKMLALKDGQPVAVTIDSYTPPYHVLYLRGIVRLSPYDGIVPEWAQAGERLMGKEGGTAFATMADGMVKAGVLKFIRLAVQPTWAGIIDFEKRFPSGIEKGMEAMAPGE
jgi:hypothetical protein